MEILRIYKPCWLLSDFFPMCKNIEDTVSKLTLVLSQTENCKYTDIYSQTVNTQISTHKQ